MNQNLPAVDSTHSQRGIIQTAADQWRLTWDNVEHTLGPVCLDCLNRLLSQAVLDLDFCSATEGEYRLEENEAGYFRLRLKTISLEMSMLEFLTLAGLVRQAFLRRSSNFAKLAPVIPAGARQRTAPPATQAAPTRQS